MNVNIGNINFDGRRFNLRKVARRGMMIASTLFVIGSSIVGCSPNNNHADELEAMVQPFSADISLEGINDMNIIINDSDCSDTFFNDVCDKLSEDGVTFTTTSGCASINKDSSVVVTLDQQYSSGSDTIIFAPYNNTRLGYSDSLALAMQAAFRQNGFLGNSITCGKIGYREDENGNVTSMIPTETEDAMDTDSDTSFVTISFGTQNVNSEWVAKSIENGLARQKYYLENYDSGSDLIYRASTTDSVEVIADYFNSDVNELSSFNNINGDTVLDSQTIINPEISEMDVFNQNAQFSMDKINTRAY